MVQPTAFKCSRCSRSYNDESALKRHWYYCRTKNPTRRAHRKRSCIPCSQAKRRCSSTLPSCSTCIAKGWNCQYEADTLRELEDLGRVSSQLGGSKSLIYDKGDRDRDLLGFQDTDPFATTGDLSELLQPLISDAKLDNPSPRTDLFDFLSSTPTELFPAADMTGGGLPLSQENIWDITIPQPVASTSLFVRRPTSLVSETNARLLRSILMSFPGMMQRQETLPPFIHPTMLGGGKDGSPSKSHGDLVQCMSLAQTWSFKHAQTTSFVWRTVRGEIEKWWSQSHEYSNHQLLACQQALLIYTLMRMSEDTRNPNPIDEPLLLTLSMISRTLVARVGNAEFIHGKICQVRSWDEWIFNESRRRIATLARLINIVVNIDTAVNCYLLSGYVLVPLPAGRLMWEATSATAWNREFDLAMTHNAVYGLAVDGSLKALQRRSDGEMDAREVKWEQYLANENGFGTMVMIAGSIIEANTSLESIL